MRLRTEPKNDVGVNSPRPLAPFISRKYVRAQRAILLNLMLLFPHAGFGHQMAPSELSAGEPLIVDAPSGLNLRPQPNSGIVGVIPDKSTIFATGAAELYATGRFSNRMRYWAPVKFQNDNGEWITGWVLLRHTTTASAPHPGPNAQSDRLVFGNSGDTDAVSNSVSQEAAPEDAKIESAETASLTVRVNSYARLRAGPGTRHNVVSRLRDGAKVKVIGKPQGHWIPIKVDGSDDKGWVHMSLLTAQGSFNPYEIAETHPKSSEDARAEIASSNEDSATEAAYNETCDGSPGCRNRSRPDLTVEDEDEPVTGKGYIRPVSGGRISSRYGRRKDPLTGQPAGHGGMDFAVPTGTPVKASRGGTVVQIQSGCRVGPRSCGGGWGNHVIVDHGNGIRTVYAHLSSVKVKVGDRVDQGEQIAKSGNTGRTSGPNMHLEVHKNGVKQNPGSYLGI